MTQSSSSKSYSSSSSSSMSSFSSKAVKTGSSTKVMAMSSSSSTSAVSIRSANEAYADHYAKELGFDIESKMQEMRLKMDSEMAKIKADFFHLMPIAGNETVKVSQDQLQALKGDNEKVKFNFDVDEFESESIHVKAVGNKVEVNAKKKSKKGDQEHSEEFSRTYELPTNQDIDPAKVTSSFYKDGVLTVELPMPGAVISSEEKKET